MELELRFDGLAEDVVDAEIQIQVQDLGIADAPPDPTVSTVPKVSVSRAHPSIRVTVDLPTAPGYEPGLRCGCAVARPATRGSSSSTPRRRP